MSSTSCSYCAAEHDATTIVAGHDVHAPRAGDLSICVRCGCLSTFTGHGLDVRPPTNHELEQFTSDPSVLRIQALVRANPPPTRPTT